MPETLASSLLPRTASAISTMVFSASDKTMMSTPLSKNRSRKFLAFTPPAIISFRGSNFLTKRVSSKTMLVWVVKIDETPITSKSAILLASRSMANPQRMRPLGRNFGVVERVFKTVFSVAHGHVEDANVIVGSTQCARDIRQAQRSVWLGHFIGRKLQCWVHQKESRLSKANCI